MWGMYCFFPAYLRVHGYFHLEMSHLKDTQSMQKFAMPSAFRTDRLPREE